MKLGLLNFGLLLNFRDVTVTLSQNVLIFVSNTSQMIGLVHFITKDWNYLAFWKKLALNLVLHFLSVSVYDVNITGLSLYTCNMLYWPRINNIVS